MLTLRYLVNILTLCQAFPPTVQFCFFLSVSHNGPVLDHIQYILYMNKNWILWEGLGGMSNFWLHSVYSVKNQKNEWWVDWCTGYTIKIDVI